jgi:hypothetical protein
MKAVHRLRVGLIGLASVFLLVMLATVFVHIAGGDQPDANAVTANDTVSSDPLAELGVAPGNPDQAEDATPPPATAPTAKPKPAHPAAH